MSCPFFTRKTAKFCQHALRHYSLLERGLRPVQLARHAAALPCTHRDALAQPDDTEVVVSGWVRSIRRHKNVAFASIFDGSSPSDLQAVMSPSQAEGIELGSAVRAQGRLLASDGRGQTKEVCIEHISVLGECPNEAYPIQKQELGPDFLRATPHLRPRTANFAAILRLRNELAVGLRRFLAQQQCHEIHAPCITFSDCEGGGEAFQLRNGAEIFGRDAYLTVSAQLHAELAASALGRVFTFGPVFRAEKHHTSRHLAEFYMLEAELFFVDSLSQLMDFAEQMLRSAVAGISTELWGKFATAQMNEQRQRLLLPEQYARLSYSEAVRLLQQAEESGKIKFATPMRWGLGLSAEHERYIAENVVNGPVFVHSYPAPVKAFYMKAEPGGDGRSPSDWRQSTVACFDLLLPRVAEVSGGSMREDRLDVLMRSMDRFGLDTKAYEWYLDLRRFGSAPHGGFGLGFDRLVQYLTLTSNIRDVVLVPRAAGTSHC